MSRHYLSKHPKQPTMDARLYVREDGSIRIFETGNSVVLNTEETQKLKEILNREL